MTRYRLKCFLSLREIKAIDNISANADRSKSYILSRSIDVATSHLTNFSVADNLSRRPDKESPRTFSVEATCSRYIYEAIKKEAIARNRSTAYLVYTLLRVATDDFTNFSIIKGEQNNGSH